MSGEYGLILPGKTKIVPQLPGKRATIFDEDSDSDGVIEDRPTFLKPIMKKQTKIAQEKAIEEDPTVYQYDEIYDEMAKQRNESKLSKKDLERKPKYISNLLRAAERRKRENERRIERQVQKEREAEGDEFKDKESYVTPSYKRKLEELRALEEKEKRDEYLETIGDVKKQGNLDGFYRHLYSQKVNYDTEIEKDQSNSKKSIDDIMKSEECSDEKNQDTKKFSKKRHYRIREDSDSEEDLEIKKEHIPSNLDADSDFSIDSSDSDTENDSKKSNVSENNKVVDSKSIKVEEDSCSTVTMKIENTEIPKESIKSENEVEIIETPLPKKPKIDIWKKRTVDEIFEAARQRYFERLALRESG